MIKKKVKQVKIEKVPVMNTHLVFGLFLTAFLSGIWFGNIGTITQSTVFTVGEAVSGSLVVWSIFLLGYFGGKKE